MSFWNYIGEFLLFRWLLSKRNRDHNAHNAYDVDSTNPPRYNDSENPIYNDYDGNSYGISSADHDNYYAHNDYSDYDNQSYNDYLDEQDDYDMIEDDF